jgi:hypothetical protein
MQFVGRGGGTQSLIVKKTACYEFLQRTSELAGPLKDGNELSGSINAGNFLTS